jgi:hypothetical protein
VSALIIEKIRQIASVKLVQHSIDRERTLWRNGATSKKGVWFGYLCNAKVDGIFSLPCLPATLPARGERELLFVYISMLFNPEIDV